MNLPSIKTLSAITSWPRELRAVLECDTCAKLDVLIESDKLKQWHSTFTSFRRVDAWVHDTKMLMADILCETCGVESTPRGHNENSPAIEYLNAGDTYAATLLYVKGRYRVGCWGDIVERGKYD